MLLSCDNLEVVVKFENRLVFVAMVAPLRDGLLVELIDLSFGEFG